jgi:hypothetical protein
LVEHWVIRLEPLVAKAMACACQKAGV